MAATDKIPLKALFSDGVPYALSQLEPTDTILPTLVDYDPTGNNHIDKETMKGAIDDVETKLGIYDTTTIQPVPYFQTYKSSTQVITTFIVTTLEFDTILYDTNSAFNVSTYEYTIPTTGIWKFQVSTRILTQDLVENYIEIKKNGATTVLWLGGRQYDVGTTDVYGGMLSMSGFAKLEANDVITVIYNGTGEITQTMASGPSYSNFSGYLHREIV